MNNEILKSESLSEFNLVPTSELSINTDSEYIENKQQGGFFWSGTSSNDKEALKSAKNGEFDFVKSLIQKNMMTNYAAADSDGNTLLHYIARDYSKCPDYNNVLDTILSKNKSNSFINKQNANGDTAMHVAVKYNHNKMAEKLDECGVNYDLKNKNGFKINYEFVENSPSTPTLSDKIRDGSFVKSNESIESIVDKFIDINNSYNTDANANNDSMDTEQFLNKLANKYQNGGGCPSCGGDNGDCGCNRYNYQNGNGCPTCGGDGAGCDCNVSFNTDQLIKKMIGGGCDECGDGAGSGCDCNNLTDSLVTDDFINNLIDEVNGNDMTGGKRKRKTKRKSKKKSNRKSKKKTKRKAKRKLNKARKSTNTRSMQLSRMISNQASIIHKEVLTMLVDALKKHKDHKGKSDEELNDLARNYKAVMWSMTKKNAPADSKNLDLAIYLKKMIDVDKKGVEKLLKEIDPKEGAKLREESRKRRQEMIQSKIQNKKKLQDTISEELSSTSSAPVPEGNYSATSFSENMRGGYDDEYNDEYDLNYGEDSDDSDYNDYKNVNYSETSYE